MNSPVTHAECETYRMCLEDKMSRDMREHQVDFKEALSEIKEWVHKLEGKMDNLVLGLLVLAIEGLAGIVIFIFTLFGGKL